MFHLLCSGKLMTDLEDDRNIVGEIIPIDKEIAKECLADTVKGIKEKVKEKKKFLMMIYSSRPSCFMINFPG